MTDYLIRHRYKNNGTTKSFLLSADTPKEAVEKFIVTWKDHVIVSMYSLSKIQLVPKTEIM